jgi:hypothetical protein
MNGLSEDTRAGASVTFVQRRESDPRLREAAKKVREAFQLISARQLVADGVVIIALADALAAVEGALRDAAAPAESTAA